MEQTSNIYPPKILLRFFRWFCHPDYLEDIEGDVIERFERRVLTHGSMVAKLLFMKDIFQLFRPSLIRPLEGTQKLNYFGMFKNYFKISFRNIQRHKTFSFLNITGLSVGLACSILIMIYVKNERSFDTYNEKYDNTYRVLQAFRSNQEAEEQPIAPASEYQVWGSAPVGPNLMNDFPEVESFFRFTSPINILVEYESKRFQERNFVYGDSTAFQTFSWDLIVGDPVNALKKPFTVVLTETTSKKYFGDLNPIGQTLTVDQDLKVTVTGVMEDVPPNTHFTFDALISMSTFYKIRQDIFDQWGYVDFYTYLEINPNADIAAMEAKFPEFVSKYIDGWKGFSMKLEPLADAYLHSEAGRQPGVTGNLTNVYVFTSIALFILLIACINFMNLSTARSVERAKEVAIRKTVGSQRIALIYQFLFEAIIITGIAAVLAAGLVVLTLPYLEILSGKVLNPDWILEPKTISMIILGIIVVGLLAGSYPAWILSNFQPVKVLKGSFKTSRQGVILRKALVVFQFSISIILLVGTTVVYFQLDHLRNHDLGFDSEQMLVIDFGWDFKIQQHREYFKDEFLKHKDVVAATVSRAVPGDFFPNGGTGIEGPDGEMVYFSPGMFEIDEDFIPTLNMEMAAGRNYSKDFPLDSANSLIINEASAKMFGYPNPEDIIGKRFDQWGRQGTVVGVVKDFNYVSLHRNVEPLSLRFGTTYNVTKITLKLNSTNYRQTLTELEKIWNDLAPHRPFVHNFLDDKFNQQYGEDQQFGHVFTVFAGLAIFIACLGLFGLTIYSTAQRTKEIGIRKVLGASAQSILKLLSIDFLKLFGISVLIAIPISYFMMSQWLQDFAYSIGISWQVFAVACLVSLLVSLVTMSLKTIRAAVSNPVDALRNE